jgi:cyclophilin family peptidyl-prolyl cis-trans isomerase
LKVNSNTHTEESPAKGAKVLFQTSLGEITIQMNNDKPITTGNFINLVRRGLYNKTIFHRVIAGFMIQGGEIECSIPSIPDEVGNNNRNARGTIAMAKTSSPNSATSQFFINVSDNGKNVIDYVGTKFDSVYTSFGTVIKGMEVVDAISKVTARPNPYTGESSQPMQIVTLIKASILI